MLNQVKPEFKSIIIGWNWEESEEINSILKKLTLSFLHSFNTINLSNSCYLDSFPFFCVGMFYDLVWKTKKKGKNFKS